MKTKRAENETNRNRLTSGAFRALTLILSTAVSYGVDDPFLLNNSKFDRVLLKEEIQKPTQDLEIDQIQSKLKKPKKLQLTPLELFKDILNNQDYKNKLALIYDDFLLNESKYLRTHFDPLDGNSDCQLDALFNAALRTKYKYTKFNNLPAPIQESIILIHILSMKNVMSDNISFYHNKRDQFGMVLDDETNAIGLANLFTQNSQYSKTASENLVKLLKLSLNKTLVEFVKNIPFQEKEDQEELKNPKITEKGLIKFTDRFRTTAVIEYIKQNPSIPLLLKIKGFQILENDSTENNSGNKYLSMSGEAVIGYKYNGQTFQATKIQNTENGIEFRLHYIGAGEQSTQNTQLTAENFIDETGRPRLFKENVDFLEQNNKIDSFLIDLCKKSDDNSQYFKGYANLIKTNNNQKFEYILQKQTICVTHAYYTNYGDSLRRLLTPDQINAANTKQKQLGNLAEVDPTIQY